MTLCQPTEPIEARQDPRFWDRIDIAFVHADFADPMTTPVSQREYARQHDIPRSTLGYWLRKDYPEHLDPDLVSFFISPAGHTFLRRLVLALLLIFRHQSPCGLRAIESFLRLVQLDPFVASSYGALYRQDLWLQNNLDCFAQEERQRLIPGMARQDIALCPDENFHGPHVCLVGIEPVSNFILVETYCAQRDSVTWAAAIRAGTQDLPVQVVLLPSDQASGLVCCATNELEIKHQPDLFHLQHDLFKSLLFPLTRPIQQAQKELEKLESREYRLEQADVKRPGSFTIDRLTEEIDQQEETKTELEGARQRREEAVEQIREVSRSYHPYDRNTGQPVTEEAMKEKLTAPLDELQEVIEKAGLPESADQAVLKGRKWVVLLVGCLGWYWDIVEERLKALDCSEEAEGLIRTLLIPGYYWEMASAKEKDPEERKRLAELGQRLQEQAWCEGSELAACSPEERAEIARVARGCAAAFQRSSSCVEGRNGRLSLFHHGQTRLSERRLKALTAVHNYVTRRADGTTAAERFFGQKQRDAFSWLLERMPSLPHPASRRPKQAAQKLPSAA